MTKLMVKFLDVRLSDAHKDAYNALFEGIEIEGKVPCEIDGPIIKIETKEGLGEYGFEVVKEDIINPNTGEPFKTQFDYRLTVVKENGEVVLSGIYRTDVTIQRVCFLIIQTLVAAKRGPKIKGSKGSSMSPEEKALYEEERQLLAQMRKKITKSTNEALKASKIEKFEESTIELDDKF